MEEHCVSESHYWWVERGYHPFETGKDGFPRPGQVVKYYRTLKINDKGKSWTQKNLAQVLGVSEQAIRDLENRDAGMNSYNRRRFLADLFNIPYVLLGIVPLYEILEQQAAQRGFEDVPTKANTQKSVRVDTQEYQDVLLSLWSKNHADAAQEVLKESLEITDSLYRGLSHAVGQERRRMMVLVCEYHQFIANVLRDRLHFAEAIHHLDAAFRLANTLKERELQALTLHRRAITWQEKGNMNAAFGDCEEACKLESYISLPLRGAIFLEAGHIQAKAARSEKEKSSALARIDQAGTIIRSAPFPDDPHFLKLNADRYYLTRGAALIALGWNKDAISELTLVHTLPEQKRRRAYNDILQAQAYANKGNYPMAASLAEAGLIAVKGIKSGINVERVSRIYVQLSESSFRNNSEVARLKYLLVSQ